MNQQSAALNYSSYLHLDELLGTQQPRSDEHDELLFIVIHQVYELWFKQILHELGALQRRLEEDRGPRALHTLRRLLAILKTVVAQIDVLETMTPRQFAASAPRSNLAAASSRPSSGSSRRCSAAATRGCSATTRRTSGACSNRGGDGAPGAVRLAAPLPGRARLRRPRGELARDVTKPREPSAEVQRVLLDAYRAEGEEAQVCERLVDLDEGLQEWRYRHVKMVERTIGDKVGTGGSPGRGVPAHHALQPGVPGSVGDPDRDVTRLRLRRRASCARSSGARRSVSSGAAASRARRSCQRRCSCPPGRASGSAVCGRPRATPSP